MKIILNGEAVSIAGQTLGALLVERGFGDAKVATAVNEAFVAKDARDGFALTDGDRVEILAPMQGG